MNSDISDSGVFGALSIYLYSTGHYIGGAVAVLVSIILAIGRAE